MTSSCKVSFSLEQIFREKVLLVTNSHWRKWNRAGRLPHLQDLGEWLVSRNFFLGLWPFSSHLTSSASVLKESTSFIFGRQLMQTLSLNRFPLEDQNICVKWNEKPAKCQHRSSGKGYFVILKKKKKFSWNSSLAKKRGMISIKMTSCLNYSLPLGITEHYSFHTR